MHGKTQMMLREKAKTKQPQKELISEEKTLPRCCLNTHTNSNTNTPTQYLLPVSYHSSLWIHFSWKSVHPHGPSHWKKVKLAGRMAIKPLKWYYQWNMIDQLNSIAQKNVGLSRVLYAQWVEAWCSFQVHFASLLPPDQAINRSLAYHISLRSRGGENIICCKFRMTDL